MTGARVVLRRELGALFHAPLAYVFLVLFVVVSQVFFVLPFFAQGTADLRDFFSLLPWFLAIFAALVTMRSWAEERQENTFEMLLTFPLRDGELVLGKFLSSFLFLAIAIACTLGLPLMVFSVGRPDPGPILTGYVGALLLAGKLVAAGVYFSGLTRSQLLAAIASTVFGLLGLTAGIPGVVMLLDAWHPGLGGSAAALLDDWGRYGSFSRGVVEASDAAWFLGWIAAFLFLNRLHVGLRRHPSAGAVLAAGTPLALGCALLVGLLGAGSSWARADLTEDKLFTLSPGTVRIFARAKDPVRVTYYVSPEKDMPPAFRDLERRVLDRLEEIRLATGGRMVVRVEHPDVERAVVRADADREDEELDENGNPKEKADDATPTDPVARRAKSLERRLIEKGVLPFAKSTLEAAATSTKVVWSALGIAYREKDEEFLLRVEPESLDQIEVDLAGTVARLVRDRAPRIALYLHREVLDPQLEQMYREMGHRPPDPYARVEQFLRNAKIDVQRVALNGYEPLPDEYDALVMIGPADLNERQQWEVSRALASGKPALLALQRYTWKYELSSRGETRARQMASEPGLDEVLGAQGLGVSKRLLLDQNHVEISFPTGTAQDLFGGLPVALPTHILVNESAMNRDSALVERLPTLLYLWGTALDLDRPKLAAKGLEATVLFSSSAKSWSADADPRALRFQDPGQYDGPFPLAVQVRGRFVDVFAGKERPKWPFQLEMMPDRRPRPMPPDAPETPLVAAPGHLVLLGCAQLWHNNYIAAVPGSRSLLLNCLDALTLDEDILLVRSKQPTDRRFDKPSDTAALLWRAVPLVFVPLVLVAVGLSIGVLRHRRREAWAAEHGR